MLVLEQLHATVDDFVAYINHLTPDQLALDGWGPREILIHLVFWHENFAETLIALSEGKKRDLPQGDFKDLNTEAVMLNHLVPVDVLLGRLLEAQRTIELLSRRENVLNDKVPLRYRSKEWLFAASVKRLEKHIFGHLRRLRQCVPECDCAD